jgi:transcriptional regulator with XRE-family HTH domain
MLSRMEATPENWARLSRLVQQKRASKGLSQSAAARAAGIHRGAWSAVEKAGDVKPYDTTLAAVERVLGWEPGSCVRVLGGGEPEPAGQTAENSLPRAEVARILIRFARTDPKFARDQRIAQMLVEIAEETLREEGEDPGASASG